MSEIAFLLGAGASIEAEMPGSATLLRKFYKEPRLKLLETHYWADAKEHIDVKKTLKSLHDMLSIRVKKSQITLETIFFALAELTARPSSLIGTFVKKWHPMVEKVNWGVLSDHLHDLLNSFLIKELAIAGDTGYLGEIAEFVHIRGGLDVFTLNHDLCLEVEFGKNRDIPIVTGFDYNHIKPYHAVWSPELFNKRERGTIYLYKLHGSVNWDTEALGRCITTLLSDDEIVK